MKHIINEPKTFTVELSKEEVQLIKDLTQNCNTNAKERKISLALFVGTSRLLGYNMRDDGTSARSFDNYLNFSNKDSTNT